MLYTLNRNDNRRQMLMLSLLTPTERVGAVGKNRLHASYSSTGAALFVTAPGGDYKDSYANNLVAAVGGGCLEAEDGTSYAVPIVSGVVALILEANPQLGWRDVQGIVASTAQITDTDNPEKPWTTNSAGLSHSYWYGFGIIDASAAVQAAKKWTNYAEELSMSGESGVINLPIREYQEGAVSSTIIVSTDENFATESVVVFLNIAHVHRGDLDVVLTSPSGTQSLLAPGKRPESTQDDESWQLMTVRNWGEPANGEWTLSLTDISLGTELKSCYDLPNWSVPVEGNALMTCQEMEYSECCIDGVQLDDINCQIPTDENGVGPAEACCECGGGSSTATSENVLKSWRIEVYGHIEVSGRTDADNNGSDVTTLDPTLSPSTPPTPGPSSGPSSGPTFTPSAIAYDSSANPAPGIRPREQFTPVPTFGPSTESTLAPSSAGGRDDIIIAPIEDDTTVGGSGDAAAALTHLVGGRKLVGCVALAVAGSLVMGFSI